MKIVEQDGKFEITTADGQKITLSRYELAGMLEQASQFRDRLPQGGGANPSTVLATRPAGVSVAVDAHHTQLVLRFFDSSGLETAFAIPREEAIKIRDDVIKHVERLERATTRPKH